MHGKAWLSLSRTAPLADSRAGGVSGSLQKFFSLSLFLWSIRDGTQALPTEPHPQPHFLRETHKIANCLGWARTCEPPVPASPVLEVQLHAIILAHTAF